MAFLWFCFDKCQPGVLNDEVPHTVEVVPDVHSEFDIKPFLNSLNVTSYDNIDRLDTSVIVPCVFSIKFDIRQVNNQQLCNNWIL